jgi:GT2 family glycosyltransferase
MALKILVATPTFNGMRYCINEFIDGIKSLTYPKCDFLIVDNSRNDDFFNELKQKEGIIVLHDKCNEERNVKRLISSRNKILDYAIQNNYDHILMMDCDVIPPKNVIEELLSCNKDIVTGLYFNYFVCNGKHKIMPVCWKSVSPEEFEEMKKQSPFPSVVKSYLDVRRALFPEEIESNELIPVLLPSSGCMLLSRNVFEKVRYGLLDMEGGLLSSDDIYFMNKAREIGFQPYCYTKIKCDHLVFGKYKKDSDGKLKHPFRI